MKVGWGGRIRTYDTRYQKPMPYHLATPQSPEWSNLATKSLAINPVLALIHSKSGLFSICLERSRGNAIGWDIYRIQFCCLRPDAIFFECCGHNIRRVYIIKNAKTACTAA